MLKGDDNNSNYLDKIYTKWFITYMILGFAVYFIVPFPLSLLASLGIMLLTIVLLNVYIMKKFKLDENNSNNNGKDNGSGIRGIFNSLSLSLYDDPRAIFGYSPLKFYCMSCGKEHKKRKCPSCGSMAVRVGWEIYKKRINFFHFYSIILDIITLSKINIKPYYWVLVNLLICNSNIIIIKN